MTGSRFVMGRLKPGTSISQARGRAELTLRCSAGLLWWPLLATAGIYGTVSYGVTQRTQEIGIRMAFGAQPGHVFGQILRGVMVVVSGGTLAGLIGAFGAPVFSETFSCDFDPRAPDSQGRSNAGVEVRMTRNEKQTTNLQLRANT